MCLRKYSSQLEVSCVVRPLERDEARGVLQTKVRERKRARVKFFCHWGEKELLRLKRSESSDLPAQSEVADRLRGRVLIGEKAQSKGSVRVNIFKGLSCIGVSKVIGLSQEILASSHGRSNVFQTSEGTM